jgi:iron complex outermembrane receptor protein
MIIILCNSGESFSDPAGGYLKEKDLSSLISVTWTISDKLSFRSAWLNYQTRQNLAEHGLYSYISSDSVNLYYQQWEFNTNTNSLTNYFNYKFNIGATAHEAIIGYDYISASGNIDQTRFENPSMFGSGSGIVGTFNLLHPLYNQMPVSNYQVSTAGDKGADPDNYYTQGIYLQDQINYKKFNLLLGIRREFYRTSPEANDSAVTAENVWLPRIGVVYGITPDMHVYALYNRGFDPYEISNKAAVYDELFKPVTSELCEVGFKAMLLKGKLFGTLSVYQLSVYNVSVNANDPSNPDLYVQRGGQAEEPKWN